MRLRVTSDLHVDCQRDQGATLFAELVADDGFDILVVAGDIAEGIVYSALSRLAKSLRGRPLVYVPGNHELWKSTRPRLTDELARAEADNENLHALDMREAEVMGVHFVGAPLWYGYPQPQWSPTHLQFVPNWQEGPWWRTWPDFTGIRDIDDWLPERNEAEARFIAEKATASSVVVTHFLPHSWSIHPDYATSNTNLFYLRDMSSYIETSRTAPRLWVHGHTHRRCDYRRGHTRVVCNPFGYPTEGGLHFDAAKTVPLVVVEAAGIEPASESPAPKRLRA